MKILKPFAYISSLFALANIAQAEQWFSQNQVEGFLSQSLIYSSDHNFLAQSDDQASVDMWEAGALFSTKVYKDLRFSGQLLGRKVSETSGNDLRVDYAFLSHPLYRSEDSQLTARLGRIRSSFGFYNETRDIPHTRTGVIMPQSVYYDQTRNSFYSADGAELHWSKSLGENALSFQVFYNQPVTDMDEAQEASQLEPSNLKGDSGLLAKLAYGSEFNGWRAAITYYRPEYTIDLNPLINVPANAILPGSPDLNDVQIYADDSSFYSETVLTSLEYNAFEWAVTAEYSRHKFQSNINLDLAQTIAGSSALTSLNATYPGVIQQYTQNTIRYLGYEESFYIQGLYRWSDQHETYVRYDYNKQRDVSFADPRGHFVDVNIGQTWRPSEDWLIRGELHYIDGWSRLFNRDNMNISRNRYWHAAMLQIAYRW
ncbi:hypothetical protein A3715_07965 [Oleiphilus sp. HI0009]|nr:MULTISPECIES: hypothetical protein [unclassified Oleiphilus]KZX80476.1 hypothetical protein A3715_07965 [Oleiphilus sp. HI0009]KZY68579.1 hypothetical protein A3739_10995 [Oleiphilus sp. HI0067]KZY71313.1 hypothetical protein A3738_14960 [Oleiphilus sp. HI0066]MCH2159803.1 hypothetical protein [Oleiphilaceae bacterium]